LNIIAAEHPDEPAHVCVGNMQNNDQRRSIL
jgi:hypothetical protein